MSITEHRVQALRQYNRPVTKKGLHSFLGAISFYRHYVKLLATETAVLSPSTAKLAPSRVIWTREMESAFTSICEFISDACILTIPLTEDAMRIVADASGRETGRVLQVRRGQEWQAVAFYSRKVRGAEQCYSVTELEALALVETICHFTY